MRNFREEQELWENENLSIYAKKSCNSIRWKEEEPDPYRTSYQRDVGRILYSDAFRRLRMKTQVFSASNSDQHNRTRLTHSLEVSQIAKSIARPLKLNIDLTEAIALGHDLGHTPFGHAGENALRKCLEGETTFNHNVQSVWIVQHTLCGRKDKYGNQYPGFNLTYDVCEGIWKHTDYEHTCDEIPGLKHLNPSKPASLEGQTVDIADGIAYLKHDIEDGVRNKLLTFGELKDVWEKFCDIPFDIQNWNHQLIYDVITTSKEKDFVNFSPDMSKLYKEIKNLVVEKIIRSPIVRQKDQEGIEKICKIYEFCINNPEYVLNKFPKRNHYIKNTYGIKRVIIDYIQWLGDENANQVYERIVKGESIDSTVEYSYVENYEF